MKIEARTLIHTYVVSMYMYMIALASKEQAGLKPNRPGGTFQIKWEQECMDYGGVICPLNEIGLIFLPRVWYNSPN